MRESMRKFLLGMIRVPLWAAVIAVMPLVLVWSIISAIWIVADEKLYCVIPRPGGDL